MENLYERTRGLVEVCQEPEKLSESELINLRIESAKLVSRLARELERQIQMCLTPGTISPEIATIDQLIMDLGKARIKIAHYLAKD